MKTKELESKLKVISDVKLVPESNIGPEAFTYTRLQDVINEGISSTFGMREKDSMILALALDLCRSMEAAQKADEHYRKLKACQLENGRLRKQLDKAGAKAADLRSELDEVRAAGLEAYVREQDLTAKVQFLVDGWPAPLEDGCITFPDGETWESSSAGEETPDKTDT